MGPDLPEDAYNLYNMAQTPQSVEIMADLPIKMVPHENVASKPLIEELDQVDKKNADQ